MKIQQVLLFLALIFLPVLALLADPPVGAAKPSTDDLQTTLTTLTSLRDAAPAKSLDQAKYANAADLVAKVLQAAKTEENKVPDLNDNPVAGKYQWKTATVQFRSDGSVNGDRVGRWKKIAGGYQVVWKDGFTDRFKFAEDRSDLVVSPTGGADYTVNRIK